MATSSERIAVIGAGVSGIAAAHVWKRCGYSVTIFEASDQIGGQWTKTYPGVRLQNTAPQYQFAEFPWPFEPDRHPTGEQVLRYLEAAIEEFELDIRLETPIRDMVKEPSGWRLSYADTSEHFAFVVVATGQYPGGDSKRLPSFEGMDDFTGEIVRNIESHEIFEDKRVAVIGFGKTALDYAAWSAERAQETVHVFRTPRWTIPDTLLGIDFTRPFFARFGSDMMPSWHHSSAPQRGLHKFLSPVVRGFWWFIATLFQFQHRRDAKLGGVGKEALEVVSPPKSQFVPDLRSATAVAPDRYYQHVAHGKIRALRSEVSSFNATGLVLANGDTIEADVVCVCCGNDAPTYPFLPAKYRALLEGRDGGPALYRHLVHPEIADIGFAGNNHGFLHIALCEMGALWQVAVHRGDLQLPSQEHMTAEAEHVAAWKAERSTYESTGNMAVNTRYQQCLDLLLSDLGVSQWRKLPNVLAEVFARYDPTDYAGVIDEYLAKSETRRKKGEVRVAAPISSAPPLPNVVVPTQAKAAA